MELLFKLSLVFMLSEEHLCTKKLMTLLRIGNYYSLAFRYIFAVYKSFWHERHGRLRDFVFVYITFACTVSSRWTSHKSQIS
jgi:hypothetical protein